MTNMIANTEKGTSSQTTYRNKDREKTLFRDMTQIIDTAILGDYDNKTKTYVPRTGRPWIQCQRMAIDCVDGYVLTNGFNYINQPFVLMDSNAAVSGIVNYQALFASVRPYPGEVLPAFFTNFVTDKISKARLRNDIADAFDLSLVLTWKSDNMITPDMMPRCAVQEFLMHNIENRFRTMVIRIGTEKDLMQVAQNGCECNDQNTRTYGRFHPGEIAYIKSVAISAAQNFVIQTDDIRWGELWSVDHSTLGEVMPKANLPT